jgi:hypothetical protein
MVKFQNGEKQDASRSVLGEFAREMRHNRFRVKPDSGGGGLTG